MEEFNWKEIVYPCIGISKEGKKVCFSEYGAGHLIEDNNTYKKGYYTKSWAMECFKPYTKPKEKTKLWYWEYKYDKYWNISTYRFSEAKAKKESKNGKTYRKIEALGFIYEDEE